MEGPDSGPNVFWRTICSLRQIRCNLTYVFIPLVIRSTAAKLVKNRVLQSADRDASHCWDVYYGGARQVGCDPWPQKCMNPLTALALHLESGVYGFGSGT